MRTGELRDAFCAAVPATRPVTPQPAPHTDNGSAPRTTTMPPSPHRFTPAELAAFERDGYVVVRGLGDEATRRRMLAAVHEGLEREVEPVEFEADVAYPGAPASRSGEGGRTVRRLRAAHARGPVFTEWVLGEPLVGRLTGLLGDRVAMPLAHHDCVMTKQPRFSSDTGWHQDVRYWSYATRELVSVWLALGPERAENGCLRVIPGTHRETFPPERFDEALFLRTDLPENRALLDRAVNVELDAGDALFFHARLFHAASRNRTDAVKVSAVFTFRPLANAPLPDSRSAAGGDLLLPARS